MTPVPHPPPNPPAHPRTALPTNPLADWRPVLPSRQLGKRPVGCRLLDREIVFYRGADRRAHALDDRCPHRRMRLSLGHVDGDRIVCPYHGWNFGADGCGRSPASPAMRIGTRCYAVAEHRGMLWLRDGAASAASAAGEPPPLRFDGYRPIGCLHHHLAAPLDLLVDNMSELEHTGSVHAVFGFETERLHEVRSVVRRTTDGIEIDYDGPQRRLPRFLQAATGIRPGDRFVQRAALSYTPLQAVYDLEWFGAGTVEQRPLALKFVIFFNAVGPQAGTQTTFVFARAASRFVRFALPLFAPVLRHLVDRELRADIALVEQLDLPPGAPPVALIGRFDRPLAMRRQAAARIEMPAEPPPTPARRAAAAPPACAHPEEYTA